MFSHDVLFKEEKLGLQSVDLLCEEEHEEQSEDPQRQEEEPLPEGVQEEEDPENQVCELRDRKKLRKPDFLGVPVAWFADSEPSNFQETMSSGESEKWSAAMEEEIDALHKNNTWILVNKPKDQKVLYNRWVYRVKKNVDGTTNKYKARLVVKGYSKKKGIDYMETFSPVIRFETIRIVLSVAAQEKLYLRQFDIKSAFLYGALDDKIYMVRPEGFDDGTQRVCKLIKSLYGLKQAPRCWNKSFKDFMMSCGLRESDSDPCLFIKKQNRNKLLVLLFVDDGLVVASDKKDADVFLKQLTEKFEATVTVNVENFLGIQIEQREDGCIFISQAAYVQKILRKYGMSDAKAVSTRMEVAWSATESSENSEELSYREMVGSLMYLQMMTRPDISFATNIASRALDKPTYAHY